MARCLVCAAFACVLHGSAALAQGYSVVGTGLQDTGAQQAPVAPAGAGTASVRPAGSMVLTGTAPRGVGEYGGVSPPSGGNVPPGFTRRQLARARGRVLVAWPGFQITPGGSRIFLAVAGQPEVTESRAAGRVIYRLRNALVTVRNNFRALETEAFPTPVERAYLRQRGRDVELIIEMRAAAEPRMSQQPSGNGLGYVYIEFAAWQPPSHLPGTVRGGQRLQDAQTPTGIRPAAPGTDDEAPPPVRMGQ